MSKIRFPEDMPKATSVADADKMMLADASTNEAKHITFDQAKQYFTIEGQRIAPVSPGSLPAGPSGQTRYMEVTAVGSWTYGGNTFTNADGYKTTLWWNGTTWSNAGSAKIKGDNGADGVNGNALAVEWTGSSVDAGLTSGIMRTYQGGLYAVKSGQTTLATDNPSTSSKYEYLGSSGNYELTNIFDSSYKFVNTNGQAVSTNENISTARFRVKKGEIVKFGINNRDVLDPSRNYFIVGKYPYGGTGTWKSTIISDNDLPLGQYYEGQWMADEDCDIIVTTATSEISSATGMPYAKIASYKNVTIDKVGTADGVIPVTDMSFKKNDFYMMTLQRFYNQAGWTVTSATSYRSSEVIPISIGDKVSYGVNVRDVGDGVNRALVIVWSYYNTSASELKEVHKVLVQEQGNYGQYITGEWVSDINGWVAVSQVTSTTSSAGGRQYFNIERQPKILTKDYQKDNLPSWNDINKSRNYYKSLGNNYIVDSFKNYNVTIVDEVEVHEHDRFDHINIVGAFGGLLAVLQIFGESGTDYRPSVIKAYISYDNGASWCHFAQKTVDVYADANPQTFLNIDGTVTILYSRGSTSSSHVRPICKTILTSDGNFSTPEVVYTGVKAGALGGVNPMRINNISYFTYYERHDTLNKFDAQVWSYNHNTKELKTADYLVISSTNTMEEPGLYELPNGDWLCYFRTNTGYVWARKSTDKGLTWGEEFRLIRANSTMSCITRLRGVTSTLEPIYVAAHSISLIDGGGGTDNSKRQYLYLSVSKDGINFEVLGYVYYYSQGYTVFEPSITEVGNELHVSYSTMPMNLGGSPYSPGGMALDCVIDKRIINNYINSI